MKAIRERFASKAQPEPNSGCHLWCGAAGKSGYGHFWANDRQHLAHRFAYELHCGPIPAGLHVCHACDVRLCVNPAHMFLGTAADNHADMLRKGRARPPNGERHHGARLTASLVQQAMGMLAQGQTQRRIAARLCVTPSVVSRIATGKTWKHITKKQNFAR